VIFLVAGVAASFGTTLLSGILVKGHDGVCYFSHGHCLASDLRALLANSVITEQRSFIKSFVEKIEADDERVKMYYTIPVPSDSIVQETTAVLPFVHYG